MNNKKQNNLSLNLKSKILEEKEKRLENINKILLGGIFCLFLLILGGVFPFVISWLTLFLNNGDCNNTKSIIEYQKMLKLVWLIIISPGMIVSILSYTPGELYNLSIIYKKIIYKNEKQGKDLEMPNFIQIFQETKELWPFLIYPLAGFSPYSFFDIKNSIGKKDKLLSNLNFIYNRGSFNSYMRDFTSTSFFWGISIDLISGISELIPLLGFAFTKFLGFDLNNPLSLFLILMLNILYYLIVTRFILNNITRVIVQPLFRLLALWEKDYDLYFRLGSSIIKERMVSKDYDNQSKGNNTLSLSEANHLIFDSFQELIDKNNL